MLSRAEAERTAGWPRDGCRWSTTWSGRWSTPAPIRGSIVEGIRAVRDQALGLLAGLGFPRRDDTGAPFDPARHEAVATRPTRPRPTARSSRWCGPATATGDHQLRPAQVVVARAG